MTRKAYTYDVYIDDKKVFTGTRIAILLRFNLDKSTFSRIINNKQKKIVLGGGSRNLVDIKIVLIDEKPKVIGSTVFNRVKKHLDEYGNTILMKKDKQVLKELEENNIKVHIKDSVYADDYWILELVRESKND